MYKLGKIFSEKLDKRKFFWYNKSMRKTGGKVMLKLDYTLETPEERKQLVEKILEECPNPTP
jgi:hypothetical protein